jgi:hypothetical protein
MNIESMLVTKIVRLAGCTATTPAGIVRFFKKLDHKRLLKHIKQDRQIAWKHLELRRNLSRDEREARRAANDSIFASAWKRNMKKKMEGLRNPQVKTLQQITKAFDSRNARQSALSDLINLAARGKYKVSNKNKIIAKIHGIEINCGEKTARKAGAHLDMRGKEATIEATKGASWLRHVNPETTWKNGKPVNYVRAIRENYVRSFALIRNTQTIDVALHQQEYSVTLPLGYEWGEDNNGLRAFVCASPTDDFHPSAYDLRCGETHIVKSINELRTKRDALRAEAAKEIELAGEAMVCLADSIRAGNCMQGTLKWINRAQLNKNRHYAVSEIVEAGVRTGDMHRVRLALATAALRHRREMERGYSILAEHTLPPNA